MRLSVSATRLVSYCSRSFEPLRSSRRRRRCGARALILKYFFFFLFVHFYSSRTTRRRWLFRWGMLLCHSRLLAIFLCIYWPGLLRPYLKFATTRAHAHTQFTVGARARVWFILCWCIFIYYSIIENIILCHIYTGGSIAKIKKQQTRIQRSSVAVRTPPRRQPVHNNQYHCAAAASCWFDFFSLPFHIYIYTLFWSQKEKRKNKIYISKYL